MSKWGRFQDGLYDILAGYEDGLGNFYPGPLSELSPDELSKTIDLIEELAANTIAR